MWVVCRHIVAVAVGVPQGEPRPQTGQPRAAAADGLPELLPADAPVGVELLQPELKLQHRDRVSVLIARE